MSTKGRRGRSVAWTKNRNKDGEEWKLIEGTEDFYISNLGRVRRNDKLKKIQVDREGYCRVHIGEKKKRLHRLVAEAFCPNPNNLPVVDHIDNNKQNCAASNLQWCTAKQNTVKAGKDGLMSESVVKLILSVSPEDEGALYNNQAECANDLNIPVKNVSKAVLGKQLTAGGYKFIKLSSFIDKREKEKE